MYHKDILIKIEIFRIKQQHEMSMKFQTTVTLNTFSFMGLFIDWKKK